MRTPLLDKVLSLIALTAIFTVGYVAQDVCFPGTCAAPPAAQAMTPTVAPTVKPAWTCKNKLAKTLYRAGFTGHAHQQAWAIVMRESNGQNLIPGHWAFNGEDWGIWQINSGAWGGQRWFTTANMSDPAKQSRIAYRILTQKGTYWRPWGLTADGQLDATHYQSWGPGLWEAWIMEPFRRYMAQYPCKTTPPGKG